MTEPEVQRWLDLYRDAWIRRDPELIAPLFAETATYRNGPFDDPCHGIEAIRAFWFDWRSRPIRDLTFQAQVGLVSGTEGVAGWQGSYMRKEPVFKRKRADQPIRLDGVARLRLLAGSEGLLCTTLDAWWHRWDVT